MEMPNRNSWLNTIVPLAYALVLAVFFAQTEIQIEGSEGWAAKLPTWRIEHHWLLDIFWGGRAMTGYHAWIFPCVALFFHFPFAVTLKWNLPDEARILGSIMCFWTCEDFLWFVLNPAFGVDRFAPQFVPWHKHWLGGAPVDYWVAAVAATLLFTWAHRYQRSSTS